MSFDDVARRMQKRHNEGMIPTYDDSSSYDHHAALAESERRAAKTRDITIGLILLVVGLLITFGTYDSASQSGGTYIIAYGPMIVGAIRLFKGLAA